jgi:hypothetical protein
MSSPKSFRLSSKIDTNAGHFQPANASSSDRDNEPMDVATAYEQAWLMELRNFVVLDEERRGPGVDRVL